jgi:hypothetical protein
MNRKIRALGIVALLSLTALVTPAAPAAADVSAQACVLYANAPYRSGNYIEATGGRSGCSNVVNIHVRIRHAKRFAPDETLAEQFVTAANYDSFLSFPCYGVGQVWEVFTEVIVGSQKVKSARVNLPCE